MRVASLAPSCTEIVFALGCGDSLIARTAFCDYPEEAKIIPAVGGWTTASVEAVVRLAPDLVLTSTFLQDLIVAQLRAAGLAVCHTDPRTLTDVLTSFETIAAALGVPDRGKELKDRVESGFGHRGSSIRHSVSLKVYAEEWPEPPMASGNWVPDLIELAGGISFLPSGQPSRTVTLGEVRAFDPDLVVLNYCGMKTSRQSQVSSFQSRPEWDKLRAVRDGRIVVLDDSLLNRPGPRLVEGARAIARALVGIGAVVPAQAGT